MTLPAIAIAEPKDPETTRSDLCRTAFAASDGTVESASAILYQLLTGDPQLFARLAEPALKAWCDNAIRTVCICLPRERIWRHADASGDDRARRRIHAFAASLRDFPLPGGLPLHRATRQDLRAGADYYRMHAADATWKARWLERIEAAMDGTGLSVGEALDEATLARLREESRED